MHIKRFRVENLYGHFTHDLELERTHREGQPSVAIIHGPNGVGKTTLLRMLNGLLSGLTRGVSRQTDVFFETTFDECTLWLSDAPPMRVTQAGTGRHRTIKVEFGHISATLERDHQRNIYTHEPPAVGLRRDMSAALHDLDFEFIETARIDRRILEERRRADLRAARAAQRETPDLSDRVARFISQAQVDFQFFFESEEPDLFARIVSRLTHPDSTAPNPPDLLFQLERIEGIDREAQQVGIRTERWNPAELRQLIARADYQQASQDQVLAVAAQYLDMLEARAVERAAITQRLRTFETLLDEFLEWKNVRIDPKVGFTISADNGSTLYEDDLSSGEHHLLYLLVSALVTRRKGTIVAIDEPEMSMHLSWQRRLIPALLKIAERAETQFILTTHSPDMATEYWQEMFAIGSGPRR